MNSAKAAFMKVASDHAYHPVVEWFEGLPKWVIVVRGVIDDGSGKKKIDIEGLKADVPQLWAEALVIEAAGKPLFLLPHLERQAEAAQQAMMAKDEWEPGLRERLEVDLPALARCGRSSGQYEGCALSPDRWEWRVSSKWLLAGEPIYAYPNQFGTPVSGSMVSAGTGAAVAILRKRD
jgi:hypothetical protein